MLILRNGEPEGALTCRYAPIESVNRIATIPNGYEMSKGDLNFALEKLIGDLGAR